MPKDITADMLAESRRATASSANTPAVHPERTLNQASCEIIEAGDGRRASHRGEVPCA